MQLLLCVACMSRVIISCSSWLKDSAKKTLEKMALLKPPYPSSLKLKSLFRNKNKFFINKIEKKTAREGVGRERATKTESKAKDFQNVLKIKSNKSSPRTTTSSKKTRRAMTNTVNMMVFTLSKLLTLCVK